MRIISVDKPGRWLVGQGNDLLINELDKMLKAKLTVYELDDYDDEEDIYLKLKIGETRNPELRNDPYPYYIMTIHTGLRITLKHNPQTAIFLSF